MKELHGRARANVAAPIESCFALLADVQSYPSWYPEGVLAVTVLETSEQGLAGRARATLRVAHGPITREIELLLAVHVEPPVAVSLIRIPHGGDDREEFEVRWRLQGGEQTRLELELHASLSVPRLVPLGGVGDAVASGFVQAAVRAPKGV